MSGPHILGKRAKWYRLNPTLVTDILNPLTKRSHVKKNKDRINRGIDILKEVLEQGEFLFESEKNLNKLDLEMFSLYSIALGEVEKINGKNYYFKIKKRLEEIKEGLCRISQNPINANRKDYDQAHNLFVRVSDTCMAEHPH